MKRYFTDEFHVTFYKGLISKPHIDSLTVEKLGWFKDHKKGNKTKIWIP